MSSSDPSQGVSPALQAVFDAAVDYAWYRIAVDGSALGGTVELASPSLAGLLGDPDLDLDDLAAWFDAVHPDDRPHMLERNAEAAANQTPFDEKMRVRDPDGTVRWIHARSRPVRNEAGEVTHYHGLVVDVTRQQRIEDEAARLHDAIMARQRAEAVAALAAKTAHDSNNLLQAVVATASLTASMDGIPDPVRADLEDIVELVSRGAQMNRELIQLASGASGIESECDLETLVQRVLRIFRRLANDRQIQAVPVAGSPPDRTVRVEATQVEQVLLNLLINARDATPPGGRIRVAVHPVDTGVQITVEDDGPGIPVEQRPHVFDLYYTTKGQEGAGLGLATARSLMDRHGGSIAVGTSELGGARFTLEFPRGARATARRLAPEPPDATKRRILLYDGNTAFLRSLQRLFGLAGFETHAASTEEGLGELLASPVDFGVACVAPSRTGPSASRLLDQVRTRHSTLPVIMMCAFLPDLERERVAQTDGTHILDKPFRLEQLHQAVREAVR